jgi:outer membrane protein, heavy metal efflux system
MSLSIKHKRFFVLAMVFVLIGWQTNGTGFAQEPAMTYQNPPAQNDRSSLTKYIDPVGGMTADQAVTYALEHNSEVEAVRQEAEAARAMVKQARLRPNPMLDLGGSRMVNGPDNTFMVAGSLPLELGGRREARVLVAEREVEIREQMVADRERMLAAEVRDKFGEVLAEALKLDFMEELLLTTRQGYKLVVARVVEGRTAPLEQNIVLVEVNRLRSMREMSEGRVEVPLLELRNMLGMKPEEPLRLKGDFEDLLDPLIPIAEATVQALAERPDLLAVRATEGLAEAQIEDARAAGRWDASVNAGYQRMRSGFPVSGINNVGELAPVDAVFNFVTFGVTINLPVRNKNQGAIEAAITTAEAVKLRREFAELTVKREVATSYARYQRAARSMEIFRAGVQGQSEANLEVIRQTYELGSKSLLDYITEQRRFIEVENEFIDAVLETYRARVGIERATNSPGLIKK